MQNVPVSCWKPGRIAQGPKGKQSEYCFSKQLNRPRNSPREREVPLPPERPELRRVEGGAPHRAVPPGLIRLGVGVVERHARRLGERLRQAVHGRVRLGVRDVVRLARGAVQGQEDEAPAQSAT